MLKHSEPIEIDIYLVRLGYGGDNADARMIRMSSIRKPSASKQSI